jgi:hypothetical protein
MGDGGGGTDGGGGSGLMAGVAEVAEQAVPWHGSHLVEQPSAIRRTVAPSRKK